MPAPPSTFGALKMIVHSYGGGVQSVGILALIINGKLPIPDRIVFVDTGREASTTWDYMPIANGRLLLAGLPEIEIVGHGFSRVDIYAHKQSTMPLLPMYSSCGGRLPTYCSGEWKRDAMRRYLRSIGVKRGEQVTMWLGISFDEAHRMKPNKSAWIHNEYPLIDLGMRRNDVLAYLRNDGWPTPPRSSCWMCPHRTATDWKALNENDFKKAVEFERDIHRTRPDLFLNSSRKPLSEGIEDHVMDGCDGGFCFT